MQLGTHCGPEATIVVCGCDTRPGEHAKHFKPCTGLGQARHLGSQAVDTGLRELGDAEAPLLSYGQCVRHDGDVEFPTVCEAQQAVTDSEQPLCTPDCSNQWVRIIV